MMSITPRHFQAAAMMTPQILFALYRSYPFHRDGFNNLIETELDDNGAVLNQFMAIVMLEINDRQKKNLKPKSSTPEDNNSAVTLDVSRGMRLYNINAALHSYYIFSIMNNCTACNLFCCLDRDEPSHCSVTVVLIRTLSGCARVRGAIGWTRRGPCQGSSGIEGMMKDGL